jgi:amino acid transporter
MISALGAINGLIFTGARVSAALGADHLVFSWLGGWNERTRSPLPAMATQAAISLLLVLAVGTHSGQTLLARVLGDADASAASHAGRGGFEALLRCSAPVFWGFFLLTAISLFVLRVKDRHLPRPFNVPLFPFLPAVFVLTCVGMLYSSIDYAGRLGWIGCGLLAAGLPIWIFSAFRHSLKPRDSMASGNDGASRDAPHDAL